MYYDTSTWISYLFDEKRTSNAAKMLIDGLPNGKDMLVMPTFAILEITETLRRRIPQIASTRMKTSKVMHMIHEKILTFFKKLTQLTRLGSIPRINYHIDMADYYRALFSTLIRMLGAVVTSPAGRRRFKGPGLKDLEHLYHALYANAGVFYTLDGGFEHAARDSAFSKLKIRILRPGRGAGIA